jgi:hypothetical protein
MKTLKLRVIMSINGDFYEFTGGDALNVSNALNLIPSSFKAGNGEEISLIGIPINGSNAYLEKLTALNYNVIEGFKCAVCGFSYVADDFTPDGTCVLCRPDISENEHPD